MFAGVADSGWKPTGAAVNEGAKVGTIETNQEKTGMNND
jgi:hypothetical protein